MPKKVFFLYPSVINYPFIPNGISILTGIAKKLGWQTAYFDTYRYEKVWEAAQGSKDEFVAMQGSGEFKPSKITESNAQEPHAKLLSDLQSAIDTFSPDLIAISCISIEWEYLMQFLPEIKIPVQTAVVIGGIHPTLESAEVVGSGYFDFVCIGEGEETFIQVLKCLENGNSRENIHGTYYLDKELKQVKKNPMRQLLREDELWSHEIDFSYFDSKYFLYPFDGKVIRRCMFELARGCPYNCTYCGSPTLKTANEGLGKYVRVRPLEAIKASMFKIQRTHDIEMYYFLDECFFSHKIEWLKQFTEWYAREIGKPFIAQTRPETVTEEKILILKNMNIPNFQVSIGVESGSKKILEDVFNRKVKVERIIHTFDLLHKHNIRTSAFFMLGAPYETRADIFKTIELCRRINPTVASVSIFQPLPGTALRTLCIKEGFFDKDHKLLFFTEGSNLKMPQISAEEIENLRKVFMLYSKLPEKYYPDIEKCEKNYSENKGLYDSLVQLRWKLENKPAVSE